MVMDLRRVRAIVTDREVLASLDPEAVRCYLRRAGWTETGHRQTNTVWVRDSEGRRDALMLLHDRSFADYARRMGEVLALLAEVEDRSQLAVLSDLLEMGEVRCPDCGSPLPVKVLRSAAGYYLGRWCDCCGPYERVSVDYFRSERAAAAALASGDYDTRVYAIENQGVRA
jgi:hypothetical protein